MPNLCCPVAFCLGNALGRALAEGAGLGGLRPGSRRLPPWAPHAVLAVVTPFLWSPPRLASDPCSDTRTDPSLGAWFSVGRDWKEPPGRAPSLRQVAAPSPGASGAGEEGGRWGRRGGSSAPRGPPAPSSGATVGPAGVGARGAVRLRVPQGPFRASLRFVL